MKTLKKRLIINYKPVVFMKNLVKENIQELIQEIISDLYFFGFKFGLILWENQVIAGPINRLSKALIKIKYDTDHDP